MLLQRLDKLAKCIYYIFYLYKLCSSLVLCFNNWAKLSTVPFRLNIGKGKHIKPKYQRHFGKCASESLAKLTFVTLLSHKNATRTARILTCCCRMRCFVCVPLSPLKAHLTETISSVNAKLRWERRWGWVAAAHHHGPPEEPTATSRVDSPSVASTWHIPRRGPKTGEEAKVVRSLLLGFYFG